MPEDKESVSLTPQVRPLHPAAKPFFGPGHAPTRGRGRPKVVVVLSGVETARRMKFDPIEWMIQIVQHGSIMELDGNKTPVETEERMRLLREVAPYVVSKAPVQVAGKIEHQHTHVDMTAIMQDPVLAMAAQKLALAMAQLEDDEPTPEPLTIEGELAED